MRAAAGPFLQCQEKERVHPLLGPILVSMGLLALAGERGTALVGVSCRGPTKKPENTQSASRTSRNKYFLNSSLINMH